MSTMCKVTVKRQLLLPPSFPSQPPRGKQRPLRLLMYSRVV